MKKLYSLIIICILSVNLSTAQTTGDREMAPLTNTSNAMIPSASVTPWQLLYNYDINAATAGNGNAGVCLLNDTFWVSRWATGDFNTLDATGALIAGPFTIPGITGVRSITTDGTSLYMGLNTAQIKKVNPITKTVISTINVPTVTNVRYVTYDPTANAGAGGFWCGTWATDWKLVSKTGTFLSTVSAVNHGLLAVYGLTFDGVNTGGPYLWAFNQTDTAVGAADIIQIQISTGLPTAVMHDVANEIGIHSDLAAGIFFQASPPAIIGVLQGTPDNRLFAYDVNFVGVNENAASPDFVSVYPNPAKDMINIGVKRNNNNNPMQMQIINSTGKVVFESRTVGISNMINMSKYPSGIYIAKITENGIVHSARIIHL